ncbi:hypothetical protein AOC03_04365 [Psychrobacter urativorans]|uniref:Uncharacterized protein n=2 Tax=Psychrobacter urativorans TaxID=45610 RepID=A0A0M4U6H1_9GAMM|nr:hypothetical protein AOC03_04365 [Psychrobacter urativorans]
MWGFYKVMYPRPPKSMMPQKGDVTTPRSCDFCGHSLAEYRGVLETRPTTLGNDIDTANSNTTTKANNDLFFCNYEHQADFHADKKYSS